MKMKAKTIAQCVLMGVMALSLSGCLAAAVGAGAVGGVLFDQNYQVESR